MTKDDTDHPAVWWNCKDPGRVSLPAFATNTPAWERNLKSLLQLYNVHELCEAHDRIVPGHAALF